MKMYISVDLEGITGMVDESQVETGERDYEYARKCLLSDLNAAVTGAFESGAEDIVVNDSHGTMTNLLLNEMPAGIRVIVGRNKCYSMMEGLDNSFQGVFFIGYHARKNTLGGTLSHSYTTRFHSVKINGMEAGEFLINGAYAGYLGVPVICVTGDQAVIDEAREIVPDIESAVVKKGLGQHSTISLTPKDSAPLITEAAARAVRKYADIAPINISSPCTLKVTMNMEVYADIACRIPALERISPVTVRCTDENYHVIFKTFLAINSVVESIR